MTPSGRSPGADCDVALLTPTSQVVVTGQIGCGKTTFAEALASRLDLVHLRLDQFNGQDDALGRASRAVDDTPPGWVLDGCVWQVPEMAWHRADLVVHLDYTNWVHYRRICRRALRRALSAGSIDAARAAIADERTHIQIMRRHADENRAGWARAGGITQAPTPVIHCRHPRDARTLLAAIPRGR